MARKITKRGLTRKLDKAFSNKVRSRGYCVRCRKVDNLQCCHIISRSHRATRWHFDNALCLCADCHMNFAHKNPLLFNDFVEEYLGRERYSQLLMMGTMVRKWSLDDLHQLYETLKGA